MTQKTNLEDTFVTSIEDTCNKFNEETFVTSIEETYVTDKLRRHFWH